MWKGPVPQFNLVFVPRPVLLTCKGVLWAESSVKPLMSLKNTVTLSYDSGSTALPSFRRSATILVKVKVQYYYQGPYETFQIMVCLPIYMRTTFSFMTLQCALLGV